MTLFLLGLAIFFGAHGFAALAHGKREAFAARLGERAFKGLFSLVSIAGFALIIIGWRSADTSSLYVAPLYLRHVAYLLMLVSIILLVAAYAPAGKIAHGVKHPMLAAVKVWAFAHLLVNGEVRSVLLFGSFLAFAVIDRIAMKRRHAPVRGPGPWRNDVIAIAAGAAGYAAIAFYLHRYIAGVRLF